MRIALINENSQGAKNTMIYNSYSYQKYGEATAGTTLLAVIILVITLCTYQTIAKNEVEI